MFSEKPTYLPAVLAVVGGLTAVPALHAEQPGIGKSRFSFSSKTQALPMPSGGDDGANLPLLAAAQVNPSPVEAGSAPAPTPDEPPLIPGTVPARPQRSVSQSVTVNLINRLVEKGVLSKLDAADLLKVAESDAEEARAQQAAAQEQVVKAAVAQALANVQASAPAGPTPADLPTDDSTVRVTYIPEVVKQQMRDQIKQDVMEQARNEQWAAPHVVPEWVTKIRLFGDIRLRYQGDYFPDGNDNTGAFPNFNAINTGTPFDTSGTVFAPQNNADQNRDRFRLRLRIGLEADLNDGFSVGVRLASGETNTPITTNQTLGLANNGQGGLFSKYSIWLDRAFLKYEIGAGTNRGISLLGGRFDNPFFSTEVAWDEDVGFDGVALLGRYGIGSFVPYITLGAFPVFNTDFNFANTDPAKFKSTDKYIYGGQIGTDWQINKDFHFKIGAAYYYYDKVQGKLSDPFVPLSASDQGNTDDLRPTFAQKGNTYMALRNITPTAANNFGTIDQFQYYGLASPFHILSLTGRIDYTHFEPFKISLLGEFDDNLAFDRNAINAIAVNNRGPDKPSGALGNFAGSGTAWIVDLRVGSAGLDKLGDWAIGMNYRQVGSDAVVDGLTESDFGGGGTNVQGYEIYGAVALSPAVNLGIHWESARQMAGPAFKQDTLVIDLNGHF